MVGRVEEKCIKNVKPDWEGWCDRWVMGWYF
jgi:hypothetical protein